VAQQEPTALLAELKTDVAPSTWAIGALIVVGAALAIAGAASAAPFWPAIIGGALMAVVAAVIAVQIAAVRSVTFRITTQRIEIERGYLSKRYGSLDLFRVKDVVLEQGLIDRMRGVGKLTVYSTDATEPVLEIGPVADARALYERLRNAVAEARRSSGTAVLQ
jgi:membrane protein YdbS with pleckstrin-like domain